MNEFEKSYDEVRELAVFEEVEYSAEKFVELIEKKEYKIFRETIAEIPSADIAEIMYEVPREKYAVFFRLLPKDTAAEVFVEMGADEKIELINLFTDRELSEVLSEECTLDVVRSVQSQIAEIVEAHKESKDPEPLTITKATVKTVLENCGVAEEKIEKLGEALDESFGTNASLTPKNVVTYNKFELSTPDVTVKVDPEHRDLVSVQTVGGEKYVMIRVTGTVEVNGVNVKVVD